MNDCFDNAGALDEIVIDGLAIDSLVGVYPHERHAAQPLVFDLRLSFDASASARSDGLPDTIDYASVVAALRGFVQTRSDQLLEKLASDCCAFISETFRPQRICLQINKPHAAQALGCARVGVRLCRDYRPCQRQWLLLLGSNLASAQCIEQAMAALGEIGRVQLLGAIEHLPPNQGSGAWYFNALACLRSALPAPALQAELKRIEQALGRNRENPGRVSIDIDVLAQGGPPWLADPHAQASGKLDHSSTRKLLSDNAVVVWLANELT